MTPKILSSLRISKIQDNYLRVQSRLPEVKKFRKIKIEGYKLHSNSSFYKIRGSFLSLTYESTCKIIFCKRLENCQICFWSDFDFRLHRKTETSCKNVTLLSINRNSWQRPYWQYKFDLLTKFKPVYEIRWQDSYSYIFLFFEKLKIKVFEEITHEHGKLGIWTCKLLLYIHDMEKIPNNLFVSENSNWDYLRNFYQKLKPVV